MPIIELIPLLGLTPQSINRRLLDRWVDDFLCSSFFAEEQPKTRLFLTESSNRFAYGTESMGQHDLRFAGLWSSCECCRVFQGRYVGGDDRHGREWEIGGSFSRSFSTSWENRREAHSDLPVFVNANIIIYVLCTVLFRCATRRKKKICSYQCSRLYQTLRIRSITRKG